MDFESMVTSERNNRGCISCRVRFIAQARDVYPSVAYIHEKSKKINRSKLAG